MDGATGYVRARIPLAREVGGYTCGNEGYVIVPLTRGPVVGNDGYGYVLVRSVVNMRTGGCVTGMVSQDVGVKLLRISPAGEASSTMIYSQHCERSFADITVCDKPPYLGDPVPDGVGVLVTGGYTTGAYRNAGNATYPRESRLTRITPDGIQYDIPADFSEIVMTDGAGIAYVKDESGVRAMDVSAATTIWATANSSLLPMKPLADGHAAMFDVSTNTVIEYGTDGSPRQSVSADWYLDYLGYQSALGMSAGTGPTGGQLTSKISLPLNEANGFYINRAAVGTQQKAPQDRGFANPETAALGALEYTYQFSALANIEYGGLICSTSGGFRWSNIITDFEQDSVSVPNSLCPPGQVAAHFHTHPPLENPFPSGNDNPGTQDPPLPLGGDYKNALNNEGIPYYLAAPAEQSGARTTWYLKYWKAAGRLPSENLCKRIGASVTATWQALVSGAVCVIP